ncbi:hypothetical protein VMCG_04947 [Cytospora schulzeri]|uniref:DUF4139 domain-containing protein n=1 Tax=Cytospora schulzeri TaxID=448051 RepID=A0A423WMQ3_9PEZI|nr:hypothetical protein VMCG_04947 [Valsa malicola]
METIQKQEFRVRDLPTRAITLFPTRAQVVRDIKDVKLKSGISQISVFGFTPTVDQHSIKVEGTGSAVISDISVELRENQEIFQEIYPDSDDEDSDSSDDEDEQGDKSPEDSDEENPSDAKQDLTGVRKEIRALNDELKRAAEVVASAESRLKMLDNYGSKVEPKSGSDMSEIMQAYRVQRDKTFEDHMNGTLRQRELKDQIGSLRKTEKKLVTQVDKEKKTAVRADRKRLQAKLKKLDLKKIREDRRYAEKERIRRERCKFWARHCYVVRITLDATQYTPISRRSSVSSVTDLMKPTVEDQEGTQTDPEAAVQTCDLSITYVTSNAFWSPSYDLQLNTTSNTGTLFFDAQLTNNTSESWKDCKIILSTSQAIFSGLQDSIPKLIPWHIKLADKSSAVASDNITSSPQEALEQRMWKAASGSASHANSGRNLIGIWPLQTSRAGRDKNAAAIFGVPPSNNNKTHGASGPGPGTWAIINNAPPPPPGNPSGGPQAFGTVATNAPAKPSLFGTESNASQPPSGQSGGGLFGGLSANAPRAAVHQQMQMSQQMMQSFDAHDDTGTSAPVEKTTTLFDAEPELSFQESAMEETGFTTTHDLPGTKSLVPSSTASKQRVAHISFTNVVFSHTIVAKYRPGAFLKAKLRNASKIPLLRGPVGLTLDGTFMGRSTLPRCSSGDGFTMSLGVDPAIKVVYPKPDVKRSTGGLFSKENSTAYTRSVTIANTRGSSSSAGGGRAARLLVLDQVPVSEDEKLRVDIVQPRGLVEGGAGVSTGVVQEGTGKDWGKAVATLKKGGEVNWDVELNAGRMVKLSLEYDVALPAGDHAVQG